jgi:hypothetical protein
MQLGVGPGGLMARSFASGVMAAGGILGES